MERRKFLKNLGIGTATAVGTIAVMNSLQAGAMQKKPNKDFRNPKYKAYYITEDCDGCGACIPECPTQTISIGPNGKMVIDGEFCINCGMCKEACDLQVIYQFPD